MGETNSIKDDESNEIAQAFKNFAIVTKEIASLQKNLVSFFSIIISKFL